MNKAMAAVVKIHTDRESAWYGVANSTVSEVGAVEGYSARTRMTFDNTYFAEGADYERFSSAASQRGIDLVEVSAGPPHEVCPVRYFGAYQSGLITNPLKPGDQVTLKTGREATIAGLDRDRLTDQRIVVIDMQGDQGPERRFFPTTMVAQAVQRLDLNHTAERTHTAPEPARKM